MSSGKNSGERSGNGQSDLLWYKRASIYQLHVRSFYDSNGDGIGDFAGLTEKLDYLQDLGITAIWLLPFYPSPLRDDGYDIADYYSINPIYGALSDFRAFLKEAHSRGLRVITELVINHTSDQHPWFQQSRRAKPGEKFRDYYVWSDKPDKYKEARIIFRDFEPSNWTWDPVAKSYFWHRFFFHQPDLNFDNPEVHREIIRVLDFWLGMGVDGLRLDAIPYLFEREGTSCENLPETHAYLKTLRKHVDEKYGDKMLLAEANQWPEDAVSYFGSGKGDECHMAFHFPVMPRLFMALRMEDRVPIVDILQQTPAIPETSQWAIFLRNHDELTLEMVTDEERDYMYRVYATDARARINLGIRRRLAPLLGNDRRKIELLNLLLFSLPGTPVIYYGDEIGMGDNIFLGDRNGVRTPMHWSSDKNAGFSRANPQALFLPIILDPEYHYEAVNVEAQQRMPNSLLWWTKRLLALTRKWKAFGQGSFEFIYPDNRKILAFIRKADSEVVLVVANLSRFAQPVELDLSAYRDYLPMELFGQTEFPRISDRPYSLTLAPYSVFWFSLQPVPTQAGMPAGESHPALEISGPWTDLVAIHEKKRLEAILPDYIRPRRWFGGKTKAISGVRLRDAISILTEPEILFLAVVSIEYREADLEEYLLPLGFAKDAEAKEIEHDYPAAVIARVKSETSGEGILYDAFVNKRFIRQLCVLMANQEPKEGPEGRLESVLDGGHPLKMTDDAAIRLTKGEQSNSSAVFDSYFLKLFRRLEPGANPDFEMSKFLTDHQFKNLPSFVAALEYRAGAREASTVAVVNEVVPSARDGWEYTLDVLGRFYENVLAKPSGSLPGISGSLMSLVDGSALDSLLPLIGSYAESARILGIRTGEMHLILGAEVEDKRFVPEASTPFSQRAYYQSLRNVALQNLHLLKKNIKTLDQDDRATAERILSDQDLLLQEFRRVYQEPSAGMRIRCHGDFHLGQTLHTGKDFFIVDFEGEPARSLGERKIKRTPLRDVAGMIRSFHYASHASLLHHVNRGTSESKPGANLEPWSRVWYLAVSAIFLRGYLEKVEKSPLLPSTRKGMEILLNASLLEKALYEIGYELNNRPDWVKIPLQATVELLEGIRK